MSKFAGAGQPIVAERGMATVPFQQWIDSVEVVPTCAVADLTAQPAQHPPTAGRMRYLTDVSKPAWGDGSIWRYADGTPV